MDAHLSRYAALIAAQAKEMLTRPGQTSLPRHDGLSVDLFKPAGLMLLDAELQPAAAPAFTQATERLAEAMVAADGPKARINDGLGHTRPVYLPLVLSLLQSVYLRFRESLPKQEEHACREALGRMLYRLDLPMLFDTPDTSLTLWKALCWLRHDLAVNDTAEAAAATAVVDMIVQTPGRDNALHPFDEKQQLLDTWWYNELTGLHALANLAALTGHRTWRRRARQIAEHHLNNIQADHATSQPWGVAAFVLDPDTTIFAEQQLHESQAGMRSPYARSAVLNGLLLADAATTLRGLIAGGDVESS